LTEGRCIALHKIGDNISLVATSAVPEPTSYVSTPSNGPGWPTEVA